MWENAYTTGNFSGGGEGRSYLGLDSQGNVYLLARAFGSGNEVYFSTIKYNGITGFELWRNSRFIYSEPYAITVVPSGDVYELSNLEVIKYDTNGNDLWIKSFLETGLAPTDIDTDSSGNLYVVARTVNKNRKYNITTAKYDANGNETWRMSYGSPAYNYNPVVFARDLLGSVYSTGSIIGPGSKVASDIVTIKYSQTN